MTTSATKYAPTDPSTIKVYLTQKPTEEFEEIGKVSVDKYNALAISRSGDEINKLLRENAASIGGDAIISVTEDFASMSGVVIKFKEKK